MVSTPTRTAPAQRVTGDAAFRRPADAHPTLLPVRFFLALEAHLAPHPVDLADAVEALALAAGRFAGPGFAGTVHLLSGHWAAPTACGGRPFDTRMVLRDREGGEFELALEGVLIDVDYLRLCGRVRAAPPAHAALLDAVFFGVGRLGEDGALACRLYAVD